MVLQYLISTSYFFNDNHNLKKNKFCDKKVFIQFSLNLQVYFFKTFLLKFSIILSQCKSLINFNMMLYFDGILETKSFCKF